MQSIEVQVSNHLVAGIRGRITSKITRARIQLIFIICPQAFIVANRDCMIIPFPKPPSIRPGITIPTIAESSPTGETLVPSGESDCVIVSDNFLIEHASVGPDRYDVGAADDIRRRDKGRHRIWAG